jgi:hypothetical protein
LTSKLNYFIARIRDGQSKRQKKRPTASNTTHIPLKHQRPINLFMLIKIKMQCEKNDMNKKKKETETLVSIYNLLLDDNCHQLLRHIGSSGVPSFNFVF